MLYPLSYEGWSAGSRRGWPVNSQFDNQDARSQRRSC
jgi:hypothetical protein